MPQANGQNITRALEQIPCGLFVLTSAHDGLRSGVLTRWVQPCSIEPPLVMVAVEKGLAVEPLIRDSRHFALCQVGEGDRLLLRAFLRTPERGDDPFVTLPAQVGPACSPIIDRALSSIECEVMRHLDLDVGYRLYVGRVLSASALNESRKPAVCLGINGTNAIDVNGLTNGA